MKQAIILTNVQSVVDAVRHVSLSSILIWLAILLIIVALIAIIRKNPYKYPYHVVKIDISRKRNVSITEEVEKYIIKHGLEEFDTHESRVRAWRRRKEQALKQTPLYYFRARQYAIANDVQHTYNFRLYRNRTKYKQKIMCDTHMLFQS
jgi:hypothetical protein